MIKTTTCHRCKIEFSYNPWERSGTYCSKQCLKRPKRIPKPGFSWARASQEEKIKRITDSFNKNVIKNEAGCWGWLGGTYPNGYTKMGCCPNGIRPLGHRISWLIHNGDIPTDKIVCHTCDNRSCTRPDHLFLGSILDNIRDKQNKNRIPLGDNHVNSKLNSIKVLKIKELLNNKYSHIKIAKMFDVSRSSISNIKNGKTWSHLKEQDD